MTGTWVEHPSAVHIGLYDPRTDCPEWAEDFNCLRPYPPAQPDAELAAREFRQVGRLQTPRVQQNPAGFQGILLLHAMKAT